MSKIELDSIGTNYASVSKVNSNFQKIEDALNDEVLYRDPPSGEPNQIEADIDLNSFKIYNSGVPTNNSDLARLEDVRNISELPESTVPSQTGQDGKALVTNGTSLVFQVPSDYIFSNVADMATKTTVGGLVVIPVLGHKLSTLGYYTVDDGGQADYVVTNDTANAMDIIDLGGGLSATLQSSDRKNVKQFGAYGTATAVTIANDTAPDDTAAINAAWTALGDSDTLVIPNGNYYIKDTGSGVALDWDGGKQNVRVECKGTLSKGQADVIMVRIGNTGSRMWECVFTGIRSYGTVVTPYETGLTGTGIQVVNLGESKFEDCRVQGCAKGYALEPNGFSKAITIVSWYNCTSQACIKNIYASPEDFEFCFVTANKWYGGYHVTDQSQFTSIETADAHLVSLNNPYRATLENTVDGNTFNGVVLEQAVTRKIYCEGNSNQFTNCYFDSGSYAIGGSWAGGVFPYRETGNSGWVGIASSNVLQKTAHGGDGLIVVGDIFSITVHSTNISDLGDYIVTAVDANTVTLNKNLSSTGDITIEHYSANIEFTDIGTNNSILDCDTAGIQAITANNPSCRIFGGRRGLLKGPLPALGTKAAAANPSGLNDTPHPGVLNLMETPQGGSGTLAAYLGNIADEATDANLLLSFVGLDGLDRLSAYAGIEANKEGRVDSQAFGGLKFSTRTNTPNTGLVDRLEIASDGDVTWTNTLTTHSQTNGIVAYAGGGQANAIELTTDYNVVGTCASAGDSVKLIAGAGRVITIYNDTGNSCDVCPESGGELFGSGGTDTAVALASGSSVSWWSVTTGRWKSI